MADAPATTRVRVRSFARAKDEGQRISALTAYDALTAKIFDEAGVDLLLVGDSAANVVQGRDSTLGITTDELIGMARAVVSGTKRAFVVADLPFGSYEASDEQAVLTAVRFMKEAGVHAVKLEGGTRMASRIRAITNAGIPVLAHIGYTPQAEHGLGGHVIQGRGAGAQQLREDALAVQDAGAFGVVIEMVPASVARELTATLRIPTIGIGAGADCDGQILVWQDAFGMNAGRVPKFVRRYADLAGVLSDAARQYTNEVRAGKFPSPDESYADTTA